MGFIPFFLLWVGLWLWSKQLAWLVISSKPDSSFPHRIHPNLTKGFGTIGPKDFFPLLDFAYMPNNSLTPR